MKKATGWWSARALSPASWWRGPEGHQQVAQICFENSLNDLCEVCMADDRENKRILWAAGHQRWLSPDRISLSSKEKTAHETWNEKSFLALPRAQRSKNELRAGHQQRGSIAEPRRGAESSHGPERGVRRNCGVLL